MFGNVISDGSIWFVSCGEKPSVDLSPGDPAVERLPACDGAVLLGGQLVGGSFSRRSLLPPGPAAGLSWDSQRPGA